MTATDTHRAIDAVWRIESARLIAGLARMVRDVGLAEELAQDALVAALERWPADGRPGQSRAPGSWPPPSIGRSTGCAASKLARAQARRSSATRSTRSRRPPSRTSTPPSTTTSATTCCAWCSPPAIRCSPTEARVALTLRLLGGLTTEEIARAFLVPEPTVAQRIVRAKRTLAEARVPFEVPRGADRAARLSSVLEVLYLIFNEGYAATAGDDWMRPALCEEALRLGRILAELAPQEPEVHGLVALMEIQASRFGARIGPSGEPVLLLDQNRARWDQLLIRRGLAALARAEALGGAPGPYALQAAIAACHARARTAAETDWARIAALYAALARAHAIAGRGAQSRGRGRDGVRSGGGPRAGRCADLASRSLESYHLLPSVRGDLLKKLGRLDEARAEFERAASLTRNARERKLLLERAAACAGGSASS